MDGAPSNAGGNPVEEIFHAALELAAARRAAYLDQACGEDQKLRRRVEALLRAAETNAGFLPEHPNSGFASSLAAEAAAITEKPGDRIGNYTLREQLGEGGFGVVFRAQQEQPIRRTVALKIVKLGMDTRQVIARFEAERQTLALMDHPNIARVLDAGATATGRPYFVMELVEGVSITQYCDAHRLSTERRLILFTQVCRAIQHAHEKGVIHRDIKPSNVLVTLLDGVPIPKVIDFGIAKAAAQSFAFNTVATALGVLGTPAYMSPEQADLQRADIDTRSDIYSLGVLLYELLTGQPPFQPKELMRLALDEVLRTIRETEPPRPSTCLSRVAREKLAESAQARGIEAAKLPGRLRGDLDCIVMKCLDKDRARRYDSAAGLARDVQRHLANEPITALRPSPVYRVEKLIRRHRFRSAAAAAALVLAVAGGFYWWLQPGTLNLDASPPDAQVEIDGRDFSGGPMPRQLKLSAGVHQVRFHKPDYQEELRTVAVPRGGYAGIPHLTLAHEQGILDVQGYPAAAGIAFAGVDYYGAIRDRRTDTGTHDLVGFAEDAFEVRRRVAVKRDERVNERVSLESGVVWKYPSTAVQSAFVVITNTPPGSSAVIVNNELGHLVFHSAADGQPLYRFETTNGNVNTFGAFTVGGGVGRVIITAVDNPERGPELFAFKDAWPTTNLWTWSAGHSLYSHEAAGLSVIAVPAASGSGAGGIAFAGHDGRLRIVNGRSGNLEHDLALGTNGLPAAPTLAAWKIDGKVYALALLPARETNSDSAGPPVYQGVLWDVNAEKTVWRRELGPAEIAGTDDFDHSGVPWILMYDRAQWRTINAMTGEPTQRGPLPGLPNFWPHLADIEDSGTNGLIFEFADPAAPMLAVRPTDGAVLWHGPTNCLPRQFSSSIEPIHPRADRPHVIGLNDGVAAIDLKTGGTLWKINASPRQMALDGDTGEIYVTLTDRRLLCLTPDGSTNWTLRLADELAPKVLVPSGRGVHKDLLLSGQSSSLELVHWPRLLWQVKAAGPIEATPHAARGPDGSVTVVQLAPWGDNHSVVGMAGTNGRAIWAHLEFLSPNRAPPFGPLDGGGADETALVTGDVRMMHIRRAADGKLIRSVPCDLDGWFTGGIAADFRGSGKSDLAVSTSGRHRIAMLSGENGHTLWEHPTAEENMGGLAAVDLDGDGLPDVVATSEDGHVYALRGKDGKPLWITPADYYQSVSPPTAADLNGDGKVQILVTGATGRFFVLDGASGRELWTPDLDGGDKQVAGRAIATNSGPDELMIVPMGTNGVVAFDWGKRREVWRSPAGCPVIAAPMVADLAHDGRRQVIAGTTTGEVLILNFADGACLCRFKLADGKIEADPVVMDLNHDGVDDILIASHDAVLYAIDGRAVIPIPVQIPENKPPLKNH